MARSTMKAVTFDLWDTVIIDDSDEPGRASRGLAPKPVERRNLVHSFLDSHQSIPREWVDVAYDTVDAAFREVWYGQNVTWTVHQRLSILLKGLGRELPKAEMEELARLHEEMELVVRPSLAPGVAGALADLARRCRLGVISDTIFSTGRTLRRILDDEGILGYFDAFVFSDELGCSKPAPQTFETAARALGVKPSEMVHVGDREQKDVGGAHAVGARSILCTVVKDRSSECTKADAVCGDYGELVSIIERLDSG